MLRTLLWYVSRETGKTFLLTAVGLTLLLSLGGGIANLLKGEALRGVEIIQVLRFVLPGALTLSLPVAGLFSATMTFGRLAADNELNACRAGGINVHYLLLPMVALALFIAGITFYFSNAVIPHYVRRLNDLVGGNVYRLVMGELTTRRYFEFRGNVIHVDKIGALEAAEESADGPPVNRFAALGGTFMELSGNTPLRIATTQSLLAEFDQRGDRPRIRASLVGVRGFDLQGGQFYETEEQPFGPIEVPRFNITLKSKWMDLAELLRYGRRPMDLPAAQDALAGLRGEIKRVLFYRAVGDGLRSATAPDGGPGHVYRFGTDQHWYTVRAERFAPEHRTERPQLRQPFIIEETPDRTREIRADLGAISATHARGDEVPVVTIQLDGGVTIVDSTDPGKPVQKASWTLPPVPMPQEILDKASTYSDRTLLDPETDLFLGRRIANGRASLNAELGASLRRMAGEIHSRTAFSISVVVTMVLGAALGAIFKGGHMMTAFGISFAPALFVIASVAMGRQVAQNEHTALAGLATIWISILLVAAADVYVLYRHLKR